jgi:hypothetical protein
MGDDPATSGGAAAKRTPSGLFASERAGIRSADSGLAEQA